MKVQTSNSLAHLQVEYQELNEQTYMLEAQLSPLAVEIRQYQQYLQCNSGDKKTLSAYRQAVRRYNSIKNTIYRNRQRMYKLQLRMLNNQGAMRYRRRRINNKYFY